MKLISLLIGLLLTSNVLAQQCNNYGVPVNGHPNWQERTQLTGINAVRMTPYEFRDYWLSPLTLPYGITILTPQWYLPVKPVTWRWEFSASTNFHAYETANTPGCPFQHNSCDGTNWITRLVSYYGPYASLGENGAMGYTDPWSTVLGLLLDPAGGLPSLDGSSGDGHRRTMMSRLFVDVGIGYAEGPNPGGRFSFQDFGVKPGSPLAPLVICQPLIDGSHDFEAGQIFYVANWYSEDNVAVASANVIVNGVSIAMSPHLGTQYRGTYKINVSIPASCRYYHFSFVDENDVTWRYPTSGEFITTRPLFCSEYYTTTPPCYADYNQSGELDNDDIFDFMNAWFAGNPNTDFNGNGTLEIQDFFDFLNSWFSGC